MIEYILLFSLGFLSAVLVAVLVAPAVRRRIVRFTENRIRATVPLSAQELRAQTDMVRATYAAENAKLGVAVQREREKGLAHELSAERLRGELKTNAEELAALNVRMSHLEAELETSRTETADRDAELLRARAEIKVRDELLAEAERRAAELGIEAEHLGGFVDYSKIDVAVRETEIENLKSAMSVLKSERDKLRDDLKAAEDRARDAAFKLEENQGRVSSLKQRLDEEVARNADMDESLDRRMRELEKLKEKLVDIQRPLTRVNEVPEPVVEEAIPPQEPEIAQGETVNGEKLNGSEAATIVVDQAQLIEGLRTDAREVADRLSGPPEPARDEALREEIASIAARMVALTASKEGAESPLLSVLDASKSEPSRGRISLAARAARALASKDA